MRSHTVESLIAAESKIVKLFEEGRLPYLLHLSGGNESQLIRIFQGINPEDFVLGTHRSHYHFLLKGGSLEQLIDHVQNGRSMFLFSKELNFLTSSIVAGLVTAAVGLALSFKLNREARRVWCFVGDGGEDEGHFYEAVRFAEAQDLPIKFIIEDNQRSVETTTEQRWGSNYRVCWPKCVYRYEYTSTFPHAGTGSKTMVQFTENAIENAKTCWTI